MPPAREQRAGRPRAVREGKVSFLCLRCPPCETALGSLPYPHRGGGTPGAPGCLRARARGKRPLATPRLDSGRPERCGPRKGRTAATLPRRAAPRRPARPRALAPARADTYADVKVKGGLPGRAARRGAGTRRWEEDRAGAAVLGFSCPPRLLTVQPLPSPSLSPQGTLVIPAQCMCVHAPVFTRTRGCA